MRIMIVTDAWHPQINGVVRTFSEMRKELVRLGHEVLILGPKGLCAPCPTYPEIRLSLNPTLHIENVLQDWQPEAVHIGTEGPMGWAMRRICLDRGWPFTTSFHTRFPEYLKKRMAIPKRWTYRFLRQFHSPSQRVMVPTRSIKERLIEAGIERTVIWGRGVDTDLFHPGQPAVLNLPRPIQLYVGRLAVEKNVEAFLNLRTPGSKVVVGDGPERRRLEKWFPKAHFFGARGGPELSSLYAAADVFVFPSFTDTFGLVLLEALASGTPVAAFPASGPIDILTDDTVASVDLDLERAVLRSTTLKREDCRNFALKHSWSHSAETFFSHLVPIPESETSRFKVSRPTYSEYHSERYYAYCPLP